MSGCKKWYQTYSFCSTCFYTYIESASHGSLYWIVGGGEQEKGVDGAAAPRHSDDVLLQGQRVGRTQTLPSPQSPGRDWVDFPNVHKRTQWLERPGVEMSDTGLFFSESTHTLV